jgi:hypothetical protein
LSVVTSLGAPVVQASDAVTAVSTVLQERLESGNFSCGFAEPVKQVASFVQELLAGCGCAGDEVVRTNIQSGFFGSQWLCQSRMVVADCDWLKGPERLCLLVVEQLQSTLLLVLPPVRVASNFEAEAFAGPKPVLVFQVFSDEDFESGVFTPLDGVRRVSDVRAEFAAIFRVAPESGLPVSFSLLFEAEERPPRFAVLAFDLLNRGRAENTAIATAILADVPQSPSGSA